MVEFPPACACTAHLKERAGQGKAGGAGASRGCTGGGVLGGWSNRVVSAATQVGAEVCGDGQDRGMQI